MKGKREWSPPPERHDQLTLVDKFIERGIIFLLIFTPLAFGTVQPWSIAVMEIVAFSVFFLFVIRNIMADTPLFDDPPRGLTALFILFSAMVALVLFQMVPLPEGLLKLLSPASLSTYTTLGSAPAGAFHPITINPWATRQELLRVLAYAAVFFVIVGHYRTKAQVSPLVKTILCMGCLLVVFAILQKVTWNGRIFWIYPVSDSLKSGAGIWASYINRNHFAGYLGMAIPLGMGFLLYSAPGFRALPETALGLKVAHFMASEKFVPCALLFLLVLVMTATLFMTFSRGGIIAFVASALFFARITWRRRTLQSKTALLTILAAVIFATVVLASWDRLEERFAELDEDHISRLTVWQDSIGIVRDYPAFGTGLGTFESAYMRYQTTMPRLLFDHAHNDYVELITDTGTIGFLLTTAMALLFFRMVFRRWRRKHGQFGKCIGAGGLAAIVAIAAHSSTDFNLHIPANALLLAVISALTYAALFNINGKNGVTVPSSSDYLPSPSPSFPSPSTGEGQGGGEFEHQRGGEFEHQRGGEFNHQRGGDLATYSTRCHITHPPTPSRQGRGKIGAIAIPSPSPSFPSPSTGEGQRGGEFEHQRGGEFEHQRGGEFEHQGGGEFNHQRGGDLATYSTRCHITHPPTPSRQGRGKIGAIAIPTSLFPWREGHIANP